MFSVVVRQSRTFQLLMLAWAAMCMGSWEGKQLGLLTQAKGDILYHMTSRSVCKARGRSRKERTFTVMAFVCSSSDYAWRSLAFLEMAEHLPADGKSWMNFLFCFAWAQGFFFTCWTAFRSAHEFSHLHPSSSLPHPTWGGSERVAIWCWAASCG